MRLDPTSLIAIAVLALASACDPAVDAEPGSDCGPANCAGCCTRDGACVGGTENTACGAGGAACAVCIASQTCTAQACQLLPVQDADGGSLPDGGTLPDGGEPTDGGADPTGPITAAPETWTWVDFPDSACGNGEATGIGVNVTAASNDVLVYMEGGGACWDAASCFGQAPFPPLAANLSTGYDETRFANEPFKSAFGVDRSQAANPFRAMSYVYIPYCTGDVHAGDKITTYGSHPPVHHKGAKNVEAFLKRLAPTFKDATRVFVSGSSAGGFGAQLNYERFAAAFPSAEVHVFADSAQMINPSGTRLSTWVSAWNLTVPAGCVNCTTDFTLYPQYLAAAYPNRRFALTAYDQDGVLSFFFNYSAAGFQAQTTALLANAYDPHQNAKYFLLAGTNHTMLGSLGTIVAPDGTTLLQFTQDFVDGAPTWSSVKPPP